MAISIKEAACALQPRRLAAQNESDDTGPSSLHPPKGRRPFLSTCHAVCSAKRNPSLQRADHLPRRQLCDPKYYGTEFTQNCQCPGATDSPSWPVPPCSKERPPREQKSSLRTQEGGEGCYQGSKCHNETTFTSMYLTFFATGKKKKKKSPLKFRMVLPLEKG